MRNLFLIALFSVAVFSFSCSNSASDPNNANSKIGYDSLSEAGDTVTQHVSAFSTAVHRMTNDINQIPTTGDADRDFAILMKSHNQGAVDLAQAELTNGRDTALKQIAQSISNVEMSEITALKKYVAAIKTGPASVASSKHTKSDNGFDEVIATHKKMMWDLSKMDTNMVADKQFVAVMIPHLLSAVYLAEGFLKYGKDARLTQMAKETILSKRKQIDELNRWMNKK